MDVVITYVNITDRFKEQYSKYVKKELEENRFRSYDTLELQVKGIRKYLPYIENIFIVVSELEQVQGLDLSDCKIITHDQIIPQKYLPCFNSCTIEMFLHKIPGLNEQFLYFNDDIFVIDNIPSNYWFKNNKPCLCPQVCDFNSEDTNIYHKNLYNSTQLIAKDLKFINKYNHKYIKQSHSIRPFLKSTCTKIFNKHIFEIFNTVTRTRHSKNFNMSLFNDYDYLSLNYSPCERNYSYFENNNIDNIINCINKKENPIICINDNDIYMDFNEFKIELHKVLEANIEGKKYVREVKKEKINITDKLIVSFTSWTKRIQYCKHTVDLMMNQTVKPYKIILNLSEEEFPNKESDLPNELLVELIQNPLFEIYWIKENTTVWKKIIPTMNRFPNDLVFSIDDDIEYPSNYIEEMYKTYYQNNKLYPVVGYEFMIDNNLCHSGPFTLTSKKFYGDLLNNIYNDLILPTLPNKKWQSDIVYYKVLNALGYKYIKCESINGNSIYKNSELNKENKYSIWNKEYKNERQENIKLIDKYLEKQNLFGVSICLSAYKTAEYIEECLDSIYSQTWFVNNKNYEILLGIDNCEETLKKVNAIKNKYNNLRIFMMDSNVGTYIVANTIMSIAKYDILVRFDTDDIMRPNMIEEIINNFNGYDLITYNFQNFGNQNNSGWACGSHALSKKIFNKYGGYQAWRCAADYDFLTRMQGIVKTKHLNLTYLRRVHENSLEFSEETNMKSKIREEYHKYIKNETKKHRIIKCIKSTYKEISLYNSIGKLYNNEKGVISLTSWKKRINNTYFTLLNLLEKCPNYHIVLVLSEEEFINKIQDLPKDIVNLVNLNKIEILWVYKNFKAFKKILFTMDKYRNIPIISADDDCIYKWNYADYLYNIWENDKSLNHIFPRHNKMVTGCGACSLYSPYCFKNAYQLLNDKIISTIEDDMFYQYLIDRLSLKQYYLPDKWPFSQINDNDALNITYKDKKLPEQRKIENYKIYDELNLSIIYGYNPKVNVNITTYPKRDKYLYNTLKNFNNQTYKVDNIILWLAHEEYDENNLPESITKCIKEKLITKVCYCNKNIYCHKRYETMKYNFADYNIIIDDDTIYENTFVENLLNKCKSTNNITCYYSFENDFIDTKRLQYHIKENTDKRKIAFQGCSPCWPPKSFPIESFNYENIRDIICPKCDETWIMSFLIKNNIYIDYIDDFLTWRINKDFDGTESSALWKTMIKKDINDIEYRVKCFANIIKFLHIEDKVLNLWPKFNIEKCYDKTLIKKISIN